MRFVIIFIKVLCMYVTTFYFHYISFCCIILLYLNVLIQPLAAIRNKPMIDSLTDWLIA